MLSPPVSVRSRVLPCDLTGERASRGRIQPPPPAPSSAAVAARRSRDTAPSPSSSPFVRVWRSRFCRPVCSVARCRRLLGTRRKEGDDDVISDRVASPVWAQTRLFVSASPSPQHRANCEDFFSYCKSTNLNNLFWTTWLFLLYYTFTSTPLYFIPLHFKGNIVTSLHFCHNFKYKYCSNHMKNVYDAILKSQLLNYKEDLLNMIQVHSPESSGDPLYKVSVNISSFEIHRAQFKDTWLQSYESWSQRGTQRPKIDKITTNTWERHTTIKNRHKLTTNSGNVTKKETQNDHKWPKIDTKLSQTT